MSTMTIDQLQGYLEDMRNILRGKNCVNPSIVMRICPSDEWAPTRGQIVYRTAGSNDDVIESFYRRDKQTLDDQLQAMREFCWNVPTEEQRKHADTIALVGRLVDALRERGMDEDKLQPVKEMLTGLSTNLLTHQR